MFLQSFRAVFVFVVYFKLRFFLLCFMNTSGRMYVNFVHVCAQKSMSFLALCYAISCHAPGIISNFQRLQRNRFRCVSCDQVLLFHHYMAYMLYSALRLLLMMLLFLHFRFQTYYYIYYHDISGVFQLFSSSFAIFDGCIYYFSSNLRHEHWAHMLLLWFSCSSTDHNFVLARIAFSSIYDDDEKKEATRGKSHHAMAIMALCLFQMISIISQFIVYKTIQVWWHFFIQWKHTVDNNCLFVSTMNKNCSHFHV